MLITGTPSTRCFSLMVQLSLQHDHPSLYALSWRGNLFAAQVHESFIRPLGGACGVLSGNLLDIVKVRNTVMEKKEDNDAMGDRGAAPTEIPWRYDGCAQHASAPSVSHHHCQKSVTCTRGSL